MNRDCIHHPDWYLATTLAERSALPRHVVEASAGSHAAGERAQRRLQRWKAQRPFSDPALFQQRLARDGLNEAQLLMLLDEAPEALARRFDTAPEWLLALNEVLETWAPETAPAMPSPEALAGQESVGFLIAFAPLIRRGHDRLLSGARRLSEGAARLPFDPSAVVEIFSPALLARLVPLVQRTMILELNVARVEGRLRGETPEDRFRDFLEQLARREVVEPLLREYNVLTRQVMRTIDQWVATSLELLRRLRDDEPAIRAAFCPGEEPGRLAQITAGAGDTHRGGRSVHLLRFDSGFQVVYKPRPLSVERHFQDLLTWLNARGAVPAFRALTVLDRDDYGWVEFVARRPCQTPAQVERFHERLGGYLALLYALEATDFHCENLIAAGEHPVLIDLESLFQPRVAGELPAATAPGDDLDYTVMRVGLLPQRIWQSADSPGVDVSGMASLAGQLAPHAEIVVEGAGTDEMRLARRRMVMGARENRPILNGEEVDALGYVDAIRDGFTRVYRLLLAHREELRASDGPLAAFAQDPMRAILRSTQTYWLLLRESSHPDVLRNALDRDRFFDRLWADVVHRPALLWVIDAERRDLENGDIPLFEFRPGSGDLWTSVGDRVADFFERPSLESVWARLGRLGEEDLERQRWFILASMATLPGSARSAQHPASSTGVPTRSVGRASAASPATPERLIRLAGAIGDRLAALARRDGGALTWVGLAAQLDEQNWEVLPLGTDLYGGLSGVALFLAHLGAISREERHTALAREAVASLSRQIEESRGRVTAIGGFVGWGSVIYTLAHLGALWNEPARFAEADAIVAGLPPLIEQDGYLDLILGAAGCIGGLISLYRCRPSRPVLAAAIQCGEHLLARATQTERGIGWITPCSGPRPLAGFSHGAAGFAWALLELAALTGQERFRVAAEAAIEEERALFVPEAGNWLDLRPGGHESGQGPSAFAWCHGAPGVGLGRLLCLPHRDDARVREEIAVALETTRAHGFGGNHSLCHGALGNLETLLLAGVRLGEPCWSEEVRRIAAGIVAGIERSGCVCGVPLGVEVPGLMVGIAGIGYQLLRLAAPSRVPSVLGLAPPAAPVEKG